MRTEQKHKLAQLRRWRIRRKVAGTSQRPRMSVCFTNQNIHIQFIDDVAGKTLAAASTFSGCWLSTLLSSATILLSMKG